MKRTRDGNNAKVPDAIYQVVKHLKDEDSRLVNSILAGLSDLSYTVLPYFRDNWLRVATERRRNAASRFIEMEENDPTLDFEAVFKMLLNDTNAEVRIHAITGLWENRKSIIMNRLIGILNDDSSEDVRATAAQALGNYAVMAECGELRSEDAVILRQALFKALEDKNSPLQLKRRALEAVAPINHPFVFQSIKNAYASGDNRLKASSLYAMGRSADVKWLPILLQELNNTDTEMRYEAAIACGELEDEAAIPGLITHTKDSDTEVQMASIKALGDIGGQQAIKHLKECLNNPREAVKELAEQMLSHIKAIDSDLLQEE
ncbi:MAG: HEAT repeat domain-containing protein [Chloroflexi bacterium]|nr:HEAT repeat domain-containing protein [Chloroflexota bacterium]